MRSVFRQFLFLIDDACTYRRLANLHTELLQRTPNLEASPLARRIMKGLVENWRDWRRLRELIHAVRPYTMLDDERLISLRHLGEYVNSVNACEDFVEGGAFKGGSAVILYDKIGNRRLWLYDSFEGLPAPSSQEGMEAQQWTGRCRANEDEVKANLISLGCDINKFVFRKGWFSETFNQPLLESVALLHCDADWFESVSLTLRTFYHLIPDGGIVVLDDFGW